MDSKLEGKKRYRYTIVAYEEVDIVAENEDEATRKADGIWDEVFGGKGLFGGVEFEGVVK